MASSRPLIEMALAFVIRHPAVTAAIIGPRTMEQLESQLTAADIGSRLRVQETATNAAGSGPPAASASSAATAAALRCSKAIRSTTRESWKL